MSYYNLPNSYYQRPDAGTPGWQLAPVPGWGTNPLLAGPKWIAANGTGSVPIRSIVADWAPVDALGVTAAERQGSEGTIALAAAAGLFVGWTFAWVYWSSKKSRKRA